MKETQFNIQLWLASHISDERELILNLTVYKASINAAKSELARLLRENSDPRLGTLEPYPGARPPRKIKWRHWKPVHQHTPHTQGRVFNRIERKSKPITARLARVQKYVEAVILWYPKGR